MCNLQRAWQTCDCKSMPIWKDCYIAFVETNLLVYLICSEIYVPCHNFTRFVRYTVIVCAVQVFPMWFSLLILDMCVDLLLNAKILIIPRTVYIMWQLGCWKCLHLQCMGPRDITTYCEHYCSTASNYYICISCAENPLSGSTYLEKWWL